MDYAEQQWTELLELHDELQSKRSTTEVSSLRAFQTHLSITLLLLIKTMALKTQNSSEIHLCCKQVACMDSPACATHVMATHSLQ
jgi:hypothetical protein